MMVIKAIRSPEKKERVLGLLKEAQGLLSQIGEDMAEMEDILSSAEEEEAQSDEPG